MNNGQLINKFHLGYKNRELALIEGVQALKHAVRFGAELEHIITYDISTLQLLLDELAPDISSMVLNKAHKVDEDTFTKISPKNHRTKVVALAKRSKYSITSIDPKKPIVFLENPKDLENIGAVIRVAAAADVGAVITDASVDIWYSGIIRGSAGLHYAIPVLNSDFAPLTAGRTIIALDPEGSIFKPRDIPHNAILIFGTERSGLSPKLLSKAHQSFRLPMKKGVSSLNLATSVAATLYSLN